jgi:hypothetical protein
MYFDGSESGAEAGRQGGDVEVVFRENNNSGLKIRILVR